MPDMQPAWLIGTFPPPFRPNMTKKEQKDYMRELGMPGKDLWTYLEDGAWALNPVAQ